MSDRYPALRNGASILAGLVIAASLVGVAAAATPASARHAARIAAAPAAAQAAKRFHLPPLQHRTGEARRSVNVRKLAAKAPKVRPVVSLPKLSPRAVPAKASPKTTTKVAAVTPPAPSPATDNGDPAIKQTPFDGLAQSSGPLTNVEPPDPWVAVGPEHVVQVVNLTMRITDRQGADPVSTSLPDFFQLPTDPVTFDSDPHVIYDSLHGRWLATELSWDCDTSFGNQFGTGYLDFAVSRTADPTGIWDQGFIFFADQLPDYPAPGTSTDKVAIASNLFDMTQVESSPGAGDCVAGPESPAGGVIDYLDWADLMNGGNFDLAEAKLTPDPGVDPLTFTPRAAVQVPATSAPVHQIFGYDDGAGGTGVFYFTVVGSVAAGTTTYGPGFDLTFDGVAASWLDPPQPVQSGGPIGPSVLDGRPTDALWQNGRLVTVSTYPCGSGPRDCIRVLDLHVPGSGTVEPTLNQDFLVSESGKDLFMGGVGLTGNGDLHLAWTRSSTSDAPSSYAAYQTVGQTANSISSPELLAAGTGAYAGDRWGDYVGVAQDPQVPSQAWNANQYSGTTEWRTKVTPLRTGGTTYVPIAPVRVLDSRINLGVTGSFSSNAAKTFQVAGVGTVDAEAVAVTGNISVTGQTAGGFVSVTVTPTNNPPSSTINFPVGQTRANNVTIPLSSTGSLSAVYRTSAGKKAHLFFDVTGYFLADDSGATFSPLATPIRVLDTRPGSQVGLVGKFQSNHNRTLVIGGAYPGIPTSATAVTGNLTMVGPTQAGFASVTKDPTNTPPTSTINFPAKTVRANGIFAPLDANHALSIVYRSTLAGTSDILLDITGYFEAGTGGLRFVPLTPSRIMDSRTGAVLSGVVGQFHSGTPKTLIVQGHWGVPTDAQAVTGNLTVASQTASGLVSVTPDPTPTPATSTINFPNGDTMANGIVAPLSTTPAGNTSFVYGSAPGKTTQLILDLSGYFE